MSHEPPYFDRHQPIGLEQIADLVQPQPGWRILDLVVPDGNPVGRLALHVFRVNESMTDRESQPPILDHDVMNGGLTADINNLPFASGVFDMVIGHMPSRLLFDPFRFVQICAHMLKFGGILLIEDVLLPDDERAARYVDAFERLCDSAHNRALAGYEWSGVFLDAGLTITHMQQFSRAVGLLHWAESCGCARAEVERLQIMLVQAPPAAARWIQPGYAGTSTALFERHYLVVVGRKEV